MERVIGVAAVLELLDVAVAGSVNVAVLAPNPPKLVGADDPPATPPPPTRLGEASLYASLPNTPPLGELTPEWTRNGELGSGAAPVADVDPRGANGDGGAAWAGVDDGACAGGARCWAREEGPAVGGLLYAEVEAMG